MKRLVTLPGERGDPRRRDSVNWVPEGLDAEIDRLRERGRKRVREEDDEEEEWEM